MDNKHKPVKALRDVKAGQLVGSEDVRVVNIDAMVAQMLELKRGLIELAELGYRPTGICPLKDNEHYELSEFLVGGGYTWDCPFCGEEFLH